MPTVYPRRDWPTLPAQEAGQYLVDAHGAFLASMIDYMNHLAGCRHLGLRYARWSWNYATDPIDDSPVGESHDLRVVWPSGPRALHVFVGFAYQASRYASTGSELALLAANKPRVDASLYNHDTSALLDDPGCKWDHEEGTLPTGVLVNGVELAVGQVIDIAAMGATYPLQYVHTGVATDDAPSSITRPRPLNVGAAGGAQLRVRLQTTHVRIHYADVWEIFERSIEL